MRMVRSVTVMLALAAAMAAGCLSPADVDDADDAVLPGSPEAFVDTTLLDGNLEVAVATPLMSLNQPGGAEAGWNFEDALQPSENTTGYVLELVWDATYPTNERLSLWVRGDAAIDVVEGLMDMERAQPLLRADGESVLRLVFSVEDLPEPEGRYSLLVRAADDIGVAVEQPFELFVTEFVGVDLDESFSALSEDGEDEDGEYAARLA